MVMVFTLVSELQDYLGGVLENLKKEAEEEVRRKLEEEKREEEVKFDQVRGSVLQKLLYLHACLTSRLGFMAQL